MTVDASWFGALPRDRLLAEMSLWSADLGRMADEIARVDRFADLYHLDVADGHFSPVLLLFPDLAKTIRRCTSRPLHVHLMVADSILLEQIRQFADIGADVLSVHVENRLCEVALALIAKLGMRAGLVLQLSSPINSAERHLGQISFLTLLGTRIGVKGQELDARALERLGEAQEMILRERAADRILLAADGGNRQNTVADLRRAGAETVVLGSLAFNDPDLPGRMAWLHALGSPTRSA
jgi:ribulose-phosphate 3-epimerase